MTDDFDFDDDDEPNLANLVFREFDCPACEANNPADEGFRSGDEVLCSYCGQGFVAVANSEGRLKLREP